jgi:DNA uptake protein ComE-like DNA-binding protein
MMKTFMPYSPVRRGRRGRKARGFVLITAMWIAIALSAVVLILCREVSVEALAARQHLSQAKADMAEIGVEQYILAMIEQEGLSPGYIEQTPWEGRELGECYFWVLKPNPDIYNESVQTFGPTDEASKLDINYATEAMLEYLPGFDSNPNLAAAIIDWRDSNDDITYNEETGAEGAEYDYYQSTYGYSAKNNLFESLDELRLVEGFTDPATADFIFFGADTNHNGTLEADEQGNADAGMSFLLTQRGIMPYVTVYGYQATNRPANTDLYTDANGNTTTAVQYSTVDDITVQYPLDVNDTNNTSLLQELLQTYATSGNASSIAQATTTRISPTTQGNNAGATTTQPYFTSIWDWIVTTQITSEDLSATNADGVPIFCLLTAKIPASASSTTAPATQSSTDGTTTTASTQPAAKTAKVNIWTASVPVLMCIPGFDQTDAESIVEYREQYPVTSLDPLQVPNISWLVDLFPESDYPGKLTEAGPYITGSSTVFSADIVTVSNDGRAFKRVKIVADASTGTPMIVYRRDMTDAGWPLDLKIRQELRNAIREGRSPNLPTSDSGATSSLGSR